MQHPLRKRQEIRNAAAGADALVKAAGDFSISSLIQILGLLEATRVFTGEFGQDRKSAAEFAAQARERKGLGGPKSAPTQFSS